MLILKFISEEYVDAYLDKGEIFLAKAEYFINEEDKSGKFDLLEGARILYLNPLTTALFIRIVGDKDKMHLPFTKATHSERNSQIKNIPLASFVLITLEDLITRDEYYSIKPEVIKGLEAISDGRPLVLSEQDHWFKNLKIALNNQEYGAKVGVVEYMSESDAENVSEEEYSINPISALFYKREKYKVQKEVRIVLEQLLGPKEFGTKIYLGNLKEFSYKLNSVHELTDLLIGFLEAENE